MTGDSERRMNVTFIARNFPPDVGGAEKLNYDLARRLSPQVNLEVVRNPFGKHSPLFYPYALFRLMAQRLRGQVDLVLLSDAMLAPLTPLFKALGVPVVLKAHGLDITYPNRLYQFMLRRFARFTDRAICISVATRSEMVKRGFDPGRCRVIPVGIDPQEYNIGQDRLELRERAVSAVGIDLHGREILFSVGRLVERKGFHWFIENVMPDLLKERGDLLYLIAGDGEMKGRIEQSINSHGLEGNVILLGEIDVETLRILYNASDVFIMPNIRVDGDMEGFGIVALEASSCGLPVVAPRLEGIESATEDRKNGLLVRPCCIEEYVQGINELLSDYRKRDFFGRTAQEFTVSRFSWDSVVQSYLSEFKSVV